jgi:hypothetical protein
MRAWAVSVGDTEGDKRMHGTRQFDVEKERGRTVAHIRRREKGESSEVGGGKLLGSDSSG